MFSKAKLKRFNEEVSSTPAPNQYDSSLKEKNNAATMDRSRRWNEQKESIPGPGAYSTVSVKPPATPTKQERRYERSKSSASLHNSSLSSTHSGSLFISPPPKPIARSTSTRSLRGRPGDKEKVTELEERIFSITKERDNHKEQITKLELQLNFMSQQLNSRSPHQCTHEDPNYLRLQLAEKERELETIKNKIEELTETNDKLQAQLDGSNPDKQDCTMVLSQQLVETQQHLSDAQQLIYTLQDEQSGLQLRIQTLKEAPKDGVMNEDEAKGLADQLDHLTLLRDNLETSVMCKDELIAELQLQLDDVVSESRTFQEDAFNYKSKIDLIEKVLEEHACQKTEAENRVRSIVAQYESLQREQEFHKREFKQQLDTKEIEIQLLNDSLSTLSVQVSQYKNTIGDLNNRTSGHLEKIASLEATISDISIITKEKEMMESMMEEEINHRTGEVSTLEKQLQQMEVKLTSSVRERELMSTTITEEHKQTDTLNKRIEKLELQLKEKEVLQQFLEKEINSRETEVTASSGKIRNLEADLETARQIALDLQQEAELQINKVLNLKASLTLRDGDCASKDELINNLKDEISVRLSETEDYESEKIQMSSLGEELKKVKSVVTFREESLRLLEQHVSQLSTSNQQLEIKIVELMGEISDREAEHIRKMSLVGSEVEELGIKYSEALLEHDAIRHALQHTADELEREKLLHMASEGDVNALKLELEKLAQEHCSMEANLKDLVQKYTNCEDALACEEASYRELEECLTSEMKAAREYKNKAEKEISTLKTSGDGYCTQITQLKIDMRKKSTAVEEMQVCIEGLRDEKNGLIIHKEQLEETLTQKEESVSKLHLQASQFEREKEEEKIASRIRIEELETNLKTTTEEQSSYKTKLQELEDKLSSVEDDKLNQDKHYEQELSAKNLELSRLRTEMEDIQGQYDGYDDKLNSLQVSVMDKTTELSAIQAELVTVTHRADLAREEAETLQFSVQRMQGDIEALNKSLISKDTHVNNLNDTLDAKSQEVGKLYKNLEEQQAKILSSERTLQEAEDNEEKLRKDKEEAVSRAAKLEEALNTTKEQFSRLEITFNEERAAEMSHAIAPLENELDELRERNAILSDEVTHWKDKFNHLEKMIEPFRDQLDAYEVEKQSLLSRSDEAKTEVDKLSKQYASLLGHQNHKQKIQHVLKLKTENNQLREDVMKLRQDSERQRKSVRRLEDKLEKLTGSRTKLNETGRMNESSRFSDKENSSILMPSNSQPLGSSTPIKHRNKPARI